MAIHDKLADAKEDPWGEGEVEESLGGTIAFVLAIFAIFFLVVWPIEKGRKIKAASKRVYAKMRRQ